jgi:lantibiotic modifying enzyme
VTAVRRGVTGHEVLARASYLGERLDGGWVRPARAITDAGRRRFDRWRNRLGDIEPADAFPGVDEERLLLAFSGAEIVRAPEGEPWADLLVEHVREPLPPRQSDAADGHPHRQLFDPIVGRAWSAVRRGGRLPAHALAGCEGRTLSGIAGWLGPAVHQSFDAFRQSRRHPLDVVLAAARDPIPDGLHRDFIDSCGPGGVELWRRRPVLARLAAQYACDDAAFVSDVLDVLDADRGELVGLLGHDPGALVELEHGLGDRHDGGRTVCRLRFADGTQLIHRPRPHDGLDVLNRVVAGLPDVPVPPLPRQLSLGTHCWVEFLAAEEVVDLERYHVAAGALLAVLRAVGASDVHRENLIRTAHGPAVIDAEVVAHPIGPRESSFADGIADRVLPGPDVLDSVLRTGLLPAWDCTESGTVVDFGHLSPRMTVEPGVGSYRILEHAGTDAERLVAPAPTPAGRPDLPAPDYQPQRWADAVVEGYRQAAGQLVGRADRPVADLTGVRVRFITRPTRSYAEVLLRAMQRPGLSDGVDLDIEFEVVRATGTADAGIVAAEQQDLRRLDIPFFDFEPVTGEFRHGGRRLDGRGVTGAEAALPTLDRTDVDRQVDVVRASMSALDGGPILSGDSCSGLAHTVLTDLLDRRVRARGGATSWFGSQAQAGSVRFLRAPVGWSLYDGQPGIALALAAGAVALGSDELDEAARLAMAPVVDRVVDDPDSLVDQVGVGYLSGAAGIVWAVRRSAGLLDDAGAHDAADLLESRLIGRLLSQKSYGTDELDLTVGIVGSLVVLAGETRVDHRRGPVVRHLTRAVLDRTPADADLAAGMAHGWAGVAYALDRAAPLLAGDPELADAAATRASDARKLADERAEGLRWCAGRTGAALVLGRAAVDTRLLADDVVDGTPHHLCCGLIGAAVSTLASTAAALPDRVAAPSIAEHRADLARSVLERLRHEAVPRYVRALPAGLHQPGLLQGAAGVALGLLLLDGHDVPNPLTASTGRGHVP